MDAVTAMKIIGHQSKWMFKRYNNGNKTDLPKASANLNTRITPAHLPCMQESVTC